MLSLPNNGNFAILQNSPCPKNKESPRKQITDNFVVSSGLARLFSRVGLVSRGYLSIILPRAMSAILQAIANIPTIPKSKSITSFMVLPRMNLLLSAAL